MTPIASSLYLVKVMAITNFISRVFENFHLKNFKIPNFEYEVIWRTPIRTKWHQVLLPSLQFVEIMAIPYFFQEFLTFFIQENSKIHNFEYEVIWRTPIRTKWYQVLLPSLQLAEVMAIPDFFQECLGFYIKENSKNQNFENEVIWRTPIRTKWHQALLPSLQLAKVMAKFEISVLQNFFSKKFKILKFWVCHFFTII
jgi:predicted Zn-dependent protease